MNRIVFLLEEQSMKTLLDGLLPRLLPGINFLCIPHEGKRDLEKSIPRKLRAWQEPGVRFIIIRDNDDGDCHALKHKLLELCSGPKSSAVMVRIACQELEAWYFGEPAAMAQAFENPMLKGIGNKARYRDPDAIVQPSREIVKLVPEFQKISGARRMAAWLSRDGNHSRSYQVLLEGIERIYREESEANHG